MPKYTKYLEFSQKERTVIRERDNYMCIFCQAERSSRMPVPPSYDGGTGSSGERKAMLGMFRAYLDEFYPDFTDTERKYDKWSFLKEKPYV